jgi:hypothetical protein
MALEDFKLREPLFVKPSVGLLEMLGIFQEGQCHLAVVTDDPSCAVDHLRAGRAPPPYARVRGLVTLEDVLEKVIQGDIVDETDRFGDLGDMTDGDASSPLHAGVVTTALVRTMTRSHLTGEMMLNDVVADGHTIERRRSRSRSRGRTSSRANILALKSIDNVVAGDVRHKDRDGQLSPMRSVGAKMLQLSGDRYAKLHGSDRTYARDTNTSSPVGSEGTLVSSEVHSSSKGEHLAHHFERDFFSDVVDSHIHDHDHDSETDIDSERPQSRSRNAQNGASPEVLNKPASASRVTEAAPSSSSSTGDTAGAMPPRGRAASVRTVCIGSPGGTLYSRGERTQRRDTVAPASPGSPNRGRRGRSNSGNNSATASPAVGARMKKSGNGQ